ncbi:MAG: class I SAM-dependent methyltransferase [Thermomicrobiaceae bacterium]
MSQEQIKDRVRKQFGGTSAAYAVSATHRSGNDLDRLVELAECHKDVEALDIATGAGHTARAIAQKVRHVVVSDLTPEMLDTAKAEMQATGIHNVSFRLADAEDLPFQSDSFDLVTCRIAPHHFSDCEQFAREVSRVLRPGGLFLLIDSTVPEEDELDRQVNELDWRRDHSHVRSFKRTEWLDMLTEAEFEIEAAEDFPKRHDFADWTSRSGMVESERAELEAWLLDAAPELRERLNVEIEDGRLIAFTDQKTLFKCRKRQAL